MLRKEKTPGPGAYNITVRPVTPTSPSYTIASKAHGELSNLENPGPGAYYPDTGRSSPSYSIHAKISTLDREKISVPGPGTYNTEHLVTHPSEPCYTMSSRKIEFPRTISPGPGQYTLPRRMTGPSYTISGKRQFYGQPDNPGPGAYSPDNRPNSPCYTMGYRTGKGAQVQTPGPGAYRPNDGEKGPSYTMAIRKADRMENSPGHNARTRRDGSEERKPGAGALQLGEAIFQSVVYYRREETGRWRKANPWSWKLRASPAWKLTSVYYGVQADESSKVRWAGAGVVLSEKLRGSGVQHPAYSIGRKLERDQDRRNQGPGPGQYRVRRADGGPKYSMHSGTQRFNYY